MGQCLCLSWKGGCFQHQRIQSSVNQIYYQLYWTRVEKSKTRPFKNIAGSCWRLHDVGTSIVIRPLHLNRDWSLLSVQICSGQSPNLKQTTTHVEEPSDPSFLTYHHQCDQQKSPNVCKSCPKMISLENHRFWHLYKNCLGMWDIGQINYCQWL